MKLYNGMWRMLTNTLELDYLAVHPENKGQGIGSVLVTSGIRLAEEIGVPIYIMAYKAGRGLYARLGFEEVDRVVQDDSKWGGAGEYGVYFMIYNVPKVTSDKAVG
jgi:N-acetylglutamate synthase-like GNAT family acetyltransferase